jgi:MFS family permease
VADALSSAAPDRAVQWLAFVADLVTQDAADQTFHMERLTPSVGPGWVKLVSGLVIGLVSSLVTGLVVGVSTALTDGVGTGLLAGLGIGSVVGLAVGLVVGLAGVNCRPTAQRHRKLTVSEFRRGLVFSLIYGLFMGLVGALLVGVVFGLIFGPFAGLIFVVVGGPAAGLVFGLLMASRWREPTFDALDFDETFQLSSRSFRAAIIRWVLGLSLSFALVVVVMFGFAFGPVIGLVFAPIAGLAIGAVLGLAAGVVFGLDDGGGYVLLQLRERRRLSRGGVMSAEPRLVFAWAVEEGLMRQVGRGYQFRHRLIRDAVVEYGGHAVPSPSGNREAENR